MSNFIKIINKYAILLILPSIFGTPWFYIRYHFFIDYRPGSFVDSLPMVVNYFIRVAVVVLLIIDFKKNNLKYVVITSFAAFFYPLLGVVIFSILLIERGRKSDLIEL